MLYIKLVNILSIILIFTACEKQDKKNIPDIISTRTMGLAYLEENKLKEAANTFQQLIDLTPDEAIGYANLGLVYIRQGNYQGAEIQLKKALERAPIDPEIQLNLAEVLLLTAREEEAVFLLEETLRHHTDHIRTLYKLGQIYAKSADTKIVSRGEDLLEKVVEFIPANITSRFDLIDLLLRNNKPDTALRYFERIEQQMPEFSAQAETYHDQCLRQLRKGNAKQALPLFNIFRNILKPTPLYRSGFDELKGIGGPLIGTPVISFSKDFKVSNISPSGILASMKFTDVSKSAGLDILPVLTDSSNLLQVHHYIISLADFDGNGTQDLYASGYDSRSDKHVRYLLKNDFGKYRDHTSQSGILHKGRDKFAIFTDYDNDGYLDLYIVNNDNNLLYYHYEPAKFKDMAIKAGVAAPGEGLTACFADFDHDGDLDLYQANQNKNRYYQNNLDGTFTEKSEKLNISGPDSPSSDVHFADFDDDGDLDLLVANTNEPMNLFSNLRQGQFTDVTRSAGLGKEGASRVVGMGDYNNDGLQDLIVFSQNRKGYSLFLNTDGTSFEMQDTSDQMRNGFDNYICTAIASLDFDNDGLLDVIFSGNQNAGSDIDNNVRLLHNDGAGVFSDATHLLPDNLPVARQIRIADYNEDGDPDIYLSAEDGRVYLLRNDGGNVNRYLKVQLVGLRTGSGKNNYFGIGAKVELKAGDSYQCRIVTEPVIHFGMGQRTKADVVRVLWTNGVPQNLFEPGSDQEILEKQILKGSCPFLYTWNGKNFEFVTDVLWRSALGMPTGIMAGETAYAFSDPSQDYFKIPDHLLKERDGLYQLQITAELWETAYLDQVKLFAIDHPESADIFVDERFTPPPFPPFKIYSTKQKNIPVSVIDENGNDLTELIREKDFKYISNMQMDKYQGITVPHDLIIDPGYIDVTQSVVLYMNGWIFPSDASINMAVSQSETTEIIPPHLQVLNQNGEWQTVIDNVSFPMGKNKFVILDLTNKFLTGERKIRIRTSMHIFWDYIFYTIGEQKSDLQVNEISMASADIHYRGFSKMYRKGGRYGPFWFDYSSVSTEPKWRDLEGFYTRYGDVYELLTSADDQYIIANAGDEISIAFDAVSAPPLKNGWKRDFILYTQGWLKDGDLNTAGGQYVDPLPFIGMTKYPYEAGEQYPADQKHQEYLRKYNTREVSTKKYRTLLLRK